MKKSTGLHLLRFLSTTLVKRVFNTIQGQEIALKIFKKKTGNEGPCHAATRFETSNTLGQKKRNTFNIAVGKQPFDIVIMEAARVKQKRKQNQMVAIMRRLFTAFLAAACFGQAKATESMCSSLNSLEDRPYWTEVATCTPCASLSGCGYCLSTLACVEGDDSGPSDGSPCPECDCAWCASEGLA